MNGKKLAPVPHFQGMPATLLSIAKKNLKEKSSES